MASRDHAHTASAHRAESGEQDWQPVVAEVTAKIANAIEPTLRTATDELYARLLYSVQDYLTDNAVFNIGSAIDAANRQALADRLALASERVKAATLLEAMRRIAGATITGAPYQRFVRLTAEAAIAKALGSEAASPAERPVTDPGMTNPEGSKAKATGQ